MRLLKWCSFPPNHRLSHSQWIYHWPPPSLCHDALRFNLFLLAQQKLGTKVTLLLPITEIDRDEGYSPSPNTEIDRDEGYSPSFGSVSIFCDHNSLQFSPLSERRALALVSPLFAGLPLHPPCFLSCLP
jgi:hypothetical protein